VYVVYQVKLRCRFHRFCRRLRKFSQFFLVETRTWPVANQISSQGFLGWLSRIHTTVSLARENDELVGGEAPLSIGSSVGFVFLQTNICSFCFVLKVEMIGFDSATATSKWRYPTFFFYVPVTNHPCLSQARNTDCQKATASNGALFIWEFRMKQLDGGLVASVQLSLRPAATIVNWRCSW
jgi:hypothetical protein